MFFFKPRTKSCMTCLLKTVPMNFSPKVIKTKSILNMWLQRDLSIVGRILLTKVEGVSRFVYPTLSLTVLDSTCKDIINIFIKFVWKNKHHHLKKEILSGSIEDDGFELLDLKRLESHIQSEMAKIMFESTQLYMVFHPSQYI